MREDSKISIVRDNSLASLASMELEKLIIAGRLPPGSRLGEAATAEMIDVSRGPIREAFRTLEGRGLLTISKSHGVYVREVSIEEAEEAYTVRAVLEGLAGKLAAGNAGEEDVAQVRALLAEMKQCCDQGDASGYSRLNIRFHAAILDLAGNKKLIETYERLVKVLTLYRHRTIAKSYSLRHSLVEHARIVDAVAAHDEQEAAKAMADHVEASRARMHETQL